MYRHPHVLIISAGRPSEGQNTTVIVIFFFYGEIAPSMMITNFGLSK